MTHPAPGTPNAATPGQLEAVGRAAALLVESGQRIGLGSGRAALAFVKALGVRVARENLRIRGVSTSLLTADVARAAGVPLAELDEVQSLDLAIDGADEVDPQMNLLKGGGGNLTREKIVASIAQRLVIVVGEEKMVDRLGTRFPVFVEVIAFGLPVIKRRLEALGATVTQRTNPDGTAFLTDNNNPYLHVIFNDQEKVSRDPIALAQQIKALPGVVETGLFAGMASEIIVARRDGTVEHRR
jgi:ribose 5-phosphate isomerase A